MVNPELHLDPHRGELHVQVPQDTGHRDDGDVVAAHEAPALAVLPHFGAGVVEDGLARAAPAAHDAGGESSSCSGCGGLVGSDLGGGGGGGAGVPGPDGGDGDLGGEEGAAVTANPGAGGVGAVHEAVLEDEGGAVGEERVALHLADADTTTLGSTFDGLARERVDGARRAHLELVVDHVTQALVVHDAQVDVGSELAARDAAVHGLVAVVVVARFAQLLAEVVGRRVLLGELERGRVLREAVQGARLARHGFDHLRDCHTCCPLAVNRFQYFFWYLLKKRGGGGGGN